MDITVGINGYGRWDYTSKCLRTIWAHERSAHVVVIDHAPDLIYPPNEFAKIIRTEPMPYAGVINYVVRNHPADWYLILNNDTTCVGRFLHLFDGYDRNTNYGCALIHDEQNRIAIETWMIIFSQASFDKIGPWDEGFKACGFEDMDWGIRAGLAGVKQEKISFPFVHGTGSRWETAGYNEQRNRNRQYLEQKHGHVGGLAHVH